MNYLAQKLILPSDCPPGATCPPPITITGPVPWALNIGNIVTKAIPFVLAFAGMGLLLMLIAGGYGVLTSSGDAKKLAGAQQRITYAILGFVIIFVAYWLVQLVGRIFGLQEIQSTFK